MRRSAPDGPSTVPPRVVTWPPRSRPLADDPFCRPETGTPAEPGGRVRGTRVVTGANAALADAHHAVLVFDAHDPLAFDHELIVDVLDTGREWAERARRDDPGAVNYLLIWNCLWRAGGSIIHGHAQALVGAGRHYERLERLRRDVADLHRAGAGRRPGRGDRGRPSLARPRHRCRRRRDGRGQPDAGEGARSCSLSGPRAWRRRIPASPMHSPAP